MGGARNALADGSGEIEPFPVTNVFQATHREDRGQIAIVDFVGNYNRRLDSGQDNVEARAVVAQEFLRTHPDSYDFLVVFSTFEFDTGNATALHWQAQNQVAGIGLRMFDVSPRFGSDGRLLGYIDMAALSRHATDPLQTAFEDTLSVLGHEVMHQWSGRARFLDEYGELSTALLGKDGSHWSDLLQTHASVLYGHKWRDNGDGTFTSEAIQSFFSPLDLYLAGWYAADEVPPFFLIDNPNHHAAVPPTADITVEGTARTITIDDILAAEGPRVPPMSEAQKEFRFAFVLLTPPGVEIEVSQTLALEQISTKFAERFAVWTGGRALAHNGPEAIRMLSPGAPETVTGSGVRTTPEQLHTALFEAVEWLRRQQRSDGSWLDKPATQLRDTAVVFEALSSLGATFSGRSPALTWLAAQSPQSTDYLARQAHTLLSAGTDGAAPLDAVLARQQKSGGWGIGQGYTPDPLDTALALAALAQRVSIEAVIIDKAAQYLATSQRPDGSWSAREGGPGRVSVTTRVLSALRRFNQQTATQEGGLAWLASQQQADGGFGEGVSTVHDTAHALRALILLEVTDRVRIDEAAAYLLAQQHTDGSWTGSRYATALAIVALNSFHFPNWRFDAVFGAEPERPVDGERVRLTLTVRNAGHSIAPETVLQLYNGVPESGGQPIGGELRVPILASGDAVTFQPHWDTFGSSGARTLVAIVDPDQEQGEGSESDNRIERVVIVEAAPAGVDLVAETLTVMPANPDTLPTTLGFTTTVRNVGTTPANDVRIQLRKGDATNGEMMAEGLYSVPGRSSVVATFTAVLTQPGATEFTVVVDADNAIDETNEGNNSISTTVETRASVDLQLAASDIRITPQPAVEGDDVAFTVMLRNAGSSLSPSTTVQVVMTDGDSTTELETQTLQIGAGSAVERVLTWRADRIGNLTFTAQLDPDQLIPELDEQNNTASLAFSVGEVNGPNLVVSFQDVTLVPNPALEGLPTTITALIRNTGDADVQDVTVGFYDGDPSQGGTRIGAPQRLASLPGGASTNVSILWPALPDASDKLVVVKVDPDNTIAEFSESDNTAFQLLDVLSRPDLALDPADVRLTPGFPTQGQPVQVDIRIINLGEQGVTDAVVRLFEGDPAAGGLQVGGDQRVAIAGGDGAVASFTWTPGGLDAMKRLVVSVDPDNAIVEASEFNNTAIKELVVQDGDFYVSHRYFSPNGDGVKDTTTFVFRVAAPSDLEVVVRDETDAVVRHFANGAFTQAQDGQVDWDGLDHLGRVVPDGHYRFHVLGSGGESVGEAVVVVDNNRSSLIDSIGTPFGSFTNLTCELGSVSQVVMTDDESSIFVRAGKSDVFAEGLYRMSGSGSSVMPLVLESGSSDVLDMQAAPDGSTVAYIQGERSDFRIRRLFLMNGDGTNRRELSIPSEDRPRRVLAVIPERHEVVLETDPLTGDRLGKLLIVSFFGGTPRVVHTASTTVENLSFDGVSPRRDAFLFSTNSAAYIANLYTAEQRKLFDDSATNATVREVQWAPDGGKVAIKLLHEDQHGDVSYRILLISAAGELLQDIVTPLSRPSNDTCLALDSNSMTWSPAGDTLAFDVLLQGIEECGLPYRLIFAGNLYTLSAETGDVNLIHEYERPDFFNTAYIANLAWSQDGSALFYQFLDGRIVALRLVDSNTVTLLETQGAALRTVSQVRLSPTGRQLLFLDDKDADDPESPCYQQGFIDTVAYKSLLNLTAELRATRLGQRHGIVLSGTASDLNFDQYLLEYASVTSLDDWRPILPASGQIVTKGEFTTWSPPGPGAYLIRLTATDLAGNTRREIVSASWSDTTSITDFYRTPEAFSPNGDGIRDDMIVHYRVLEPVHLTFVFYNDAGERVRTMIRNHSEIGVAHTLIWDGRDDQGLLLPDGVYRVEVLNFQLSVVLDASPPEVYFVLNDPYQAQSFAGSDVAQVAVAPSLSWSISEPNYLQADIDIAPTGSPDQWRLYLDVDPQQRGDGKVRSRGLSLAETDNAWFRLVAEDQAGNRTIVETRIAPQLIIDGFGNHEVRDASEQCQLTPSRLADCLRDQGGYYAPLERVPYAPMASSDGPDTILVVTEPSVRFAVAENIEAPLTRVIVQYRSLSESDWQEVALTEFLDRAPLPHTDSAPLEQVMDAVWRLPHLTRNVQYVARLKAFDGANQVYLSNALRFVIEDHLVLHGLTQSASEDERLRYRLSRFASPGKHGIWGLNASQENLSEVHLLISSPDDPRYRVEQDIGRITQPGEVLRFEAELAACRTYIGKLVGTTQSGVSMQSDPTYFTIPCLNLAVKVEPPSALDCNQPSARQLNLHFAPSALDGGDLKLLTLARTDAAGREDIVYNINRPESVAIQNVPENAAHIHVYDDSVHGPDTKEPAYPYRFTYDVSTLSGDAAQLVARLINVNDEAIALPVELMIDQTPPSLALTYPPEGALVCGVPTLGAAGERRNIITIQGSASDANGVHYTLSEGGFSIYDSRHMRLSPSGQLVSLQPPLAPFHLDQINGPLGQLVDRKGAVTVQLDVFDWGGFRQCVQRSFVVDAQVDTDRPAVAPELFSPNDDGVVDTVSIHHQSLENTTLDVHIYAAREDRNGEKRIDGPILRRLETGRLLLNGVSLSTWDGLDDSGATPPDGWYGIVSIYTDTCGNQRQYEQFVEVDTTPPVAVVSYPATGSPITMLVEIQGSVQDAHLSAYRVQVGAGSAPATWATLQRAEQPVLNGVLGQWNTFGVSGPQVIRLIAEDRVGNIRVVDVPLSVEERTHLISALSASPSLFSPNGDGKWEQTSLNIGVQEDVLLTLTVLDEGGQLRRTLALNRAAATGVARLTWDGLDDAGLRVPDGTYSAVVKATLAANTAVTQAETLTVVIDATPPQVEITRPAAGIVTATGQVLGRIVDEHLSVYTVSITETPQGPQSIVLSTGTLEVDNAPLGALLGLQEGPHTLTIEAIDEAANQAVTHFPFVVDNTPPVVGLIAPLADSFIGSQQSPVDILGSISDDHFAQYTLRFGAGETPSAWMDLSQSDVLPATSLLGHWEVAYLAEGLYTLHMLAEDKAGLQTETRLRLIVDNTPPSVALTRPTDGTYITDALIITGTATDDHLTSYDLELAPETAPEQGSAIGSGTQSVSDGVLFQWQALPPDGVYILRLTAMDKAGHQAETEQRVTVDTTPLDAPLGLDAVVADQTVQLTWQASMASDIAGYAVYRDGQRLTPEPLATPAYVDTAISEGRYVYTVVAIDRAGLESQPSAAFALTVDITPPSAQITAPVAGAIVSGVVDITGTAYSQADFKQYRVSIGEGVSPTAWQLLRQSPAPIQSESLTQWTTLGLSEGAPYTIQLEAEDLNGNVALATATVIVDNQAPAAPTGLVASALSSSVHLTWSANSESDLHGYFVYRNGQPAIASGVDSRDLRQAAIQALFHTDQEVPDGPSSYTIVAIDRAGNVSAPSAPASVTLNTRVPRAEIVNPADGAVFDGALYVRATVADRDIAYVRFEYKPAADSSWLAVAGADAAAPYDAMFDPAAFGLPFGAYELRAIATDTAHQVDSNPEVITVRYTDLTRPEPVQSVTARVTGEDVQLTWDAHTESNLDGYHIERRQGDEAPVWITPVPISGVNYVDSGLAEAIYRYAVIAVDTFGNASEASEEAAAKVYTPILQPLRTPTLATTVTLSGQGIAAATVSGEVETAAGSTPLTPGATDANGQFELSDLPLVRGENRFTLRLTDALGNVSKAAVVTVIQAEPPSAPAGLTATVVDSDVELNWTASAASDVQHYAVYRDAVLRVQTPDLRYTDAGLVNGTYRYTVQAVDQSGNASEHSNAVDAVVAMTPPEPPDNLTVMVEPTGGVLQLHWQPGSTPAPSRFQVLRSKVSGGPYAMVVETDEPEYADTELSNGVTYFYVVAAVDAIGNRSDVSNEASGEPRDQVTPETPRLHFPTVPGRLLISHEPDATIIGLTEPGVEVQLLANGQRVRFTQAQETSESHDAPLDFGAVPTLSPDGRYVAYVKTNASNGGSEGEGEGEEGPGERFVEEGSSEEAIGGSVLHLYDSQTDDFVEIAAVANTNSIRWSPDSVSLIFNDVDAAHGVAMIRQYHLADETLTDLTNPSEVDMNGAALSPDGQQWVFSGTVQGQHGLWIRQGDAGIYTPLVAMANAGELVGASLRWSPDGAYIAYTRKNAYELVEVATGEVRRIENAASSAAVSWAPDASSLLFGTTGPSPQIRRYDIDAQAVADIAFGQTPHWSADGRFALFIDPTGTAVIRHDLETGVEEILAQEADLTPATLQAVASGHVGFLTGFEPSSPTYRRLSLAGRFVFDRVRLAVGDNVFAAIAADLSGNASSASESILITHRVDDQADLALTAADIQVLPAAPRVDDVTRVSVTVHNQGMLTSADTTLSLVAINPDGSATVLLNDHPIAPLVAGGWAVFSTPWTLGGLTGRYTLVAVVDPANIVFENSEANNVAIIDLLVTDDALPAISVSLDAFVYSSHQPIEVTVTATNGGDPWTGRVDIAIEDGAGFPVATLPGETIAELAYSGRLTLTPTWETSGILAGAYRAVSRLYDPQDRLIAEAVAPFRIAAKADLTATVASERPVYAANEQVRATGVMTYVTGNQMLTDTIAVVRLTNTAGDILAERTAVWEQLLPGTQAAIELDWHTGIQPVGTYQLQFDVLQGGNLLQRAHSQFILAPSGLQLVGRVSLSASALAPGTAQTVTYTVTNEGNVPVVQVPIFIRLLDPISQTPVQDHRVLTDIAVVGQVSHTVRLETGTLFLRRYTVLIQAGVDDGHGGEERLTLAASDFVVADRDAPVVAVVAPQASSFLSRGRTVEITARDESSSVARVEFRLDSGVWRAAIPQGSIDRIYGATLPHLSPGAHTIQARAVDAVGHAGLSPVVAFTVDYSAPQIVVSGVASGQSYAVDVTPVITITDPHLASASILLNGRPFESGQVVSDEGVYQLAISASDAAGNRDGVKLAFVIDKMAPVIAIQGVEANQAYNAEVTPVITVTDATAVTQTVTLNGEPFVSGMVVNAEGDYTLTVQAADATGYRASKILDFRIDTTAPVIVVDGVEDYAVYRVDPYFYPIVATDADGDALTYALLTAPPGMTIDADTGLITWAQLASGDHLVTVQVKDELGASDTQVYSLTVAVPNLAPTIASDPVVKAQVGQRYQYQVNAADPNGDPVTYRLETAPAGMTIESETGLLTWEPDAAEPVTVVIRVEDPYGTHARQSYTIAVSEPL
jgi:subtilase family serine protease/fibronectin type 3 domain-containing protein